MTERRLIVKCSNEGDGRSHQSEAVPVSVIRGRPHECYKCRIERVGGAPTVKDSAQDRNSLFDACGRVREVHMVSTAEVPDV